jgi:hypothetical protein
MIMGRATPGYRYQESTMRSPRRYLLLASVAFICLAVSSSAAAETKVHDWPDSQMPVLVENESGLIFITNEKRPHRAYSWSRKNAGDGFASSYLVDVDNDGSPEIVGAGKPVFVLATNSDPMWAHEKGCHQTIVANFWGDDGLELLCNDGRGLKLYTYDGQSIWSLELGRRVDHCRAGDYTGNLKADLECKYRGRDEWARVDADGEIIAESISEAEISEGGVDLDLFSGTSDLLDGETYIDLDKNGHADERLSADGEALVIGSKARDTAIARVELDGEAEAALVKDLDADGTNEIVAVTKKSIFIISPDGKEKTKYSANAKSYKRKPFAQLNSVYANNFADNDAAQKVVEGLQDKLSKCYASRVRRNRFVGTGQLILTVNAGEGGKVSGVDRVHSDVNDKTIENCAKKALKSGKYPDVEDEQTGTVNVNMKYTFRDE